MLEWPIIFHNPGSKASPECQNCVLTSVSSSINLGFSKTRCLFKGILWEDLERLSDVLCHIQG